MCPRVLSTLAVMFVLSGVSQAQISDATIFTYSDLGNPFSILAEHSVELTAAGNLGFSPNRIVAVFVAAESETDHRQYGAHEHGVGRLMVALDGAELVIALECPAANVVGFEHGPRDEAQQSALEQALAVLTDADALFVLPERAGCELADVSVETPLVERTEHDHDRYDEEHARHKEGHRHDEMRHAAHADIEAEYRYHCENPQALQHIDIRLFERFPATESLTVQFVTSQGQSAAELNAKSRRIEF